ncbi:Cupredoxin [Mycena rebaudengoi]|nr:Cupredoxin [Mycena rebaudengoi]
MDHLIKVGADGLTYTPSSISAAVGDTVTFEFHPKNHTVTQSSFEQPCKPLEENGKKGFKSGFQFVEANAINFPTFRITVNDTQPIWGYCGQTGHCSSGMVFAINAVENGPKNFAAFQARANATATAPPKYVQSPRLQSPILMNCQPARTRHSVSRLTMTEAPS